jgi:hypothetical protein
MSRNLLSTECANCDSKYIVAEEEPRQITKEETGVYYDEFQDLKVFNAICNDCGAKYIAWHGTRRGMGRKTIGGVKFYDLSYRSTFNDEPGSSDIPERQKDKQPSHDKYDLVAHIKRQKSFSLETFGTGDQHEGIINHISDELDELARSPGEIEEWIDVINLAIDGAHRQGYSAERIAGALEAKLRKNENRDWPDQESQSDSEPVFHLDKSE